MIRAALETEDRHWDWTMTANARALLSLARACAPDMEPGSSIVGVSSLGSTRVMENYVLVGASKAALESVVRYLAVELAPREIRVNAVSAGLVETGALEHFPNREEMLSSSRARTPAGRMVESEDVAAAVAFLCSPDAEMVRGHVLVVTGRISGTLLPGSDSALTSTLPNGLPVHGTVLDRDAPRRAPGGAPAARAGRR